MFMKRKRLLTITSLALVLGLTVATGAGSTYIPRAEEKEVTKYTYPMEIYSITGNHNFANSRINFIHIYDKLKGNDNFANATIGAAPQGGYDMWFGGIEGDRNFTNLTADAANKGRYAAYDVYVKNDLIGDDNFDGTVLQGFYLRIGGTLKGRFGKVEVNDPVDERYPVPYIRAGVLEDVDFSKLGPVYIDVDKETIGDNTFANMEDVTVNFLWKGENGYRRSDAYPNSFPDSYSLDDIARKDPTPVHLRGKHLFKGCKKVHLFFFYSADEKYSKYNTIIDDPYLFEDLAECDEFVFTLQSDSGAIGSADRELAIESTFYRQLKAVSLYTLGKKDDWHDIETI